MTESGSLSEEPLLGKVYTYEQYHWMLHVTVIAVLGISVIGPRKSATKNSDNSQTIFLKSSDPIQAIGIFADKENVTNCGREFIPLFSDGIRNINRNKIGKYTMY